MSHFLISQRHVHDLMISYCKLYPALYLLKGRVAAHHKTKTSDTNAVRLQYYKKYYIKVDFDLLCLLLMLEMVIMIS